MSLAVPTRTFSLDRRWSFLSDLFIFAAVLAVFYGIWAISRSWFGPVNPVADISTDPWELPVYSAYSLLRILLAYFMSLIFSIGYGYAAAYNARAEKILVPVLDVLQSIPVLSFLPGVMLAMVALFPHTQLGVELGVILLIFTGQVWNITFSFYSSLKSIPHELHEVAQIYQWSWWQRFIQLELPYASIGLVWNSMLSVAGGWFFLMACEMFVLGNRDFRLPGLGSYLQLAASSGNTHDVFWGLVVMIGIIVTLDQLVWRPVINWVEKFKFEQVEGTPISRSLILGAFRRSLIIRSIQKVVVAPVSDRLTLFFARRHEVRRDLNKRDGWSWKSWVGIWFAATLLFGIGYGAFQAIAALVGLTRGDLREILIGSLWTFMRVNVALLIGCAWTIPVGVAIGSSPRLARFAQPFVQVAASVPATALFPVILLILIASGGGIGSGSILLMLLGTQWYILFNVIAGVMAIPADLKEAALAFDFGRNERWRLLYLPGIFPYLVTGLATASGGAWNASIIAEYFDFKGQILSTDGLGAIISRASDSGNFTLLLAATIVMAGVVVTMNRLVWRRLYRLAQTRFQITL